jgi:hypothetical protein
LRIVGFQAREVPLHCGAARNMTLGLLALRIAHPPVAHPALLDTLLGLAEPREHLTGRIAG